MLLGRQSSLAAGRFSVPVRTRFAIKHHRSRLSITALANMSDKSNKAVVIEKPEEGQQPEFSVKDIGKPKPGDGEVLVKMKFMPVNPSDLAATTLRYPAFNRAKKFPAILGLEGFGVIEGLGSGASKFKVGQRLVSASWGGDKGDGTWQQYKTIPEAAVIPVPDNVSDEVAAMFLVNPCTAVGFLSVLKIPEGKWLIQTAANSEIGRMVASLCKHRGIKTINIVRRSEAKQEVLDAGGDVVISTSEDKEFVGKVKEVTGGEFAYGAIDPVAGDSPGALASCIRPGGSVLVYGAMGGKITIDNIQLRDLLFRGVNVTGFWLSIFLSTIKKEEFGKFTKEVMDLLEQGVIKPRPGRKFPLDKVKEALAASLESGKNGKVLLEA